MKKFLFKNFIFLFVLSCIVIGCSEDEDEITTQVSENEQEQEEEKEEEQEETEVVITVEDFDGAIDENEAKATSLGIVVATASEGTLVYSIESQNPEGAVSINSETGELSIADDTIFDYETNTTVTGVINATVGNTTNTLDFTITINDVEDASLTISSSSDFFIDENPETGAIIGSVVATTNGSATLIYSIENVSTLGAIVINDLSGEITVAESEIFDFETITEITATIQVALGDIKSDTQDITITILDLIEPLSVSTFAGSMEGYVDGDISIATFDRPTGMAMDAAGNIYVTEYGNHTVRKITPQGIVSTLAGGFNGYQDGTGTNARLFRPSDIIMGNDGFLYVADTWNNRIRKISLNGVVTTLAGSTGGYAEGTGSNAKFDKPTGLTMDSSGNIYVTDLENHRIRKITPNGLVSTLAGGTSGFNDGTGTAAQFRDATGIVINSNNELFVTDYFGRTVRKITLNGEVTTFAGRAGISGSFDRERTASTFGTPYGIAIDFQGDILVSDWTHNNIRKISSSLDEVTTLAGMSNTSSGESGDKDGIATEARFNNPAGIFVAPDGKVYIADYDNHRIRIIQ